MWNISKEAKEKFVKCNILPIYECDEQWEMALREAKEEGEDLIARLKEELEEVQEELVHILPSRFIPYVENGTLNQPTLSKAVREDYLQWIQQANKEFELLLDAAYENTKKTMPYLPAAVQDVFAESLHDAVMERIEREGDTLHLYLNIEGGFSSKAFVHLMFQNMIEEETDEPIRVGQWLIYNELQKIENGFAFRVLFDCPDAEWTITTKQIDAEYYYRPALYVILRDEGKVEETTLAEYVAQLNPAHRYWLITPHVICAVQSLSENINLVNGQVECGQHEVTVTVGHTHFTYQFDEYNPIQFIYTDIYEDPYEHLNKPVPIEEIEAAVWSDTLELQVRAWNTMYANSTELADMINRVLEKLEVTEENEMMVSVYVNHFYEEGILTEAMIEKYRTVMY